MGISLLNEIINNIIIIYNVKMNMNYIMYW